MGCCRDVYNGNQWYVDQTLGPGHDLEEFYTAPATKAAYKLWVHLSPPKDLCTKCWCQYKVLLSQCMSMLHVRQM